MTTTTSAVATTASGALLVAPILYFASKNGYADMPNYVAVDIAGLIILAAHTAVHVISRLKVWQRWVAPAPVALQQFTSSGTFTPVQGANSSTVQAVGSGPAAPTAAPAA